MGMNVFQFGRGGEGVRFFMHTYAGIRITDMQIQKKDIDMSRVMRITSKKVEMNLEENTKHAARATQVEKKTYTHDTDS